jgi:RNA polymerase subunit RPABC4/transcription elongation factor Spt4
METFVENLVAFLTSPLFATAVKFFFLFLFAFHFSIAIWVARDVSSRSHNLLLQIFFVTLTVLLPFLGLVIYLLLRPAATLSEKIFDHFLHWQDFCSFCGMKVEKDFEFCPSCGQNLTQKCTSKKCGKEFSGNFLFCPFCGKRSLKAED